MSKISGIGINQSANFTSRWLVLLIDFILIFLSFFLAITIRFNFNVESAVWDEYFSKILILSIVYLLGFFLFRSYVGVIRHTSMVDAMRIFSATTFSLSLLLIIHFISQLFLKGNGLHNYLWLPLSIIFIHYLLVNFVLLASRGLFKLIYFRLIHVSEDRINILIFGAGEAGVIAKRVLVGDGANNKKVLGFFDDNKSKIGNSIDGVSVYSFDKHLDHFLNKHRIDHMVLAVQNISVSRKRAIVDICLEKGIEVKVVPPVSSWVNGELRSGQIQKIRMIDLLGREPIKLNVENVSKELKGKNILVTGAAGSIGSEIVKQVLRYSPNKVLLLDQAETPLFELDFFLRKKMPSDVYSRCQVIVCDVVDYDALDLIFDKNNIDIVYHAAAYKHVPIIENNPIEGVKTNIIGTKNCADLSVKHKVGKFVMVSTDKAVNPTNVMGATKRVAEKYTNTLIDKEDTNFIITRFGNVLGSNGSVIPLFRQQIEEGGPILITHKEIERYFMTIPEACQLVLEAGAMGEGGEIFVFDMGESVKIYDVAKKMIKLAGLKLNVDIKIDVIGLRPGEKLYEELLTNSENCVETHHPKIMKALIEKEDIHHIEQKINSLLMSVTNKEVDMKVVSYLKQIVPEYVSNNSKFQSLD